MDLVLSMPREESIVALATVEDVLVELLEPGAEHRVGRFRGFRPRVDTNVWDRPDAREEWAYRRMKHALGPDPSVFGVASEEETRSWVRRRVDELRKRLLALEPGAGRESPEKAP